MIVLLIDAGKNVNELVLTFGSKQNVFKMGDLHYHDCRGRHDHLHENCGYVHHAVDKVNVNELMDYESNERRRRERTYIWMVVSMIIMVMVILHIRYK